MRKIFKTKETVKDMEIQEILSCFDNQSVGNDTILKISNNGKYIHNQQVFDVDFLEEDAENIFEREWTSSRRGGVDVNFKSGESLHYKNVAMTSCSLDNNFFIIEHVDHHKRIIPLENIESVSLL